MVCKLVDFSIDFLIDIKTTVITKLKVVCLIYLNIEEEIIPQRNIETQIKSDLEKTDSFESCNSKRDV